MLAHSPSQREAGRTSLQLSVLLVALAALAPLLALGVFGLAGSLQGRDIALGPAGLEQLSSTVLLVLLTGVFSALLGTSTGWLTARCAFPGRRWLRMTQLLPLATPSYLLAATLIDLGSRLGERVQGMPWAVVVLGLTTYPYVFLLSTESFAVSGRRQQEACRSLGVGPWGGFWRVALPMALPAIGAGVALTGMEVVNELGAVQLLGVPSLSAGILLRWQQENNPEGAVLLALLALAIVAVLVAAERQLRRRSRSWSLDAGSDPLPLWPLQGWRRWGVWMLAALPPALSLGLPLLWAGLSWDLLQAEPLDDLLALTGRTFGLSLGATALTVAMALLLALAHRWLGGQLIDRMSFVAGLGYAIPGTVLALGLMLLGGPAGLPAMALLVWGYTDRFLAVAKGGLDAAFERLSPSLDEAATSLGHSWLGVLRQVHLPLLRSPLLVGALLVFVDTVKELPITFSLRPFDFDTLAVRVFQYASDERIGAALVPALLILLLGLVATLALIPGLEKSEQG